jgi:hypothetical protein
MRSGSADEKPTHDLIILHSGAKTGQARNK